MGQQSERLIDLDIAQERIFPTSYLLGKGCEIAAVEDRYINKTPHWQGLLNDLGRGENSQQNFHPGLPREKRCHLLPCGVESGQRRNDAATFCPIER